MMFEWQKHSQIKLEVPHYDDLLEFIDLREQASEISLPSSSKHLRNELGCHELSCPKKSSSSGKAVTSFAVNSDTVSGHCVLCGNEHHPLYVCPRFRSMSHDNRISTVRRLNLCMNCLNNSHFIKNCNSLHKCKKCQQSHHTMIHNETHNDAAPRFSDPSFQPLSQVASNAAVKLKSSALLRTLSEDHRSPRTSCPPGHLVLGSRDLPRTMCPPSLLLVI